MSNVRKLVEEFEALRSPPQQPRVIREAPPAPSTVRSLDAGDYLSVKDSASVATSARSSVGSLFSASGKVSSRQSATR